MSDNIKDIINQRVPSYYRNDSELTEYLEVCGELFDELRTAIKQHDHFNDYKYVPESRLNMLARKFAFDPPSNVPSELLRGIVRDIAAIYSTKGVEQSLFWVFRLLGWKARFEYAWILNPERFDPNITTAYPEYFERDGLESDVAAGSSFVPRMDEGYNIGLTGQLYEYDDSFYVQGQLRMGRNPLTYLGQGTAYDPFTRQVEFNPSTDFQNIDYRNFVYGESRTLSSGTYFFGRTPDSTFNDLRNIRIVGEKYRDGVSRFRDVVIKTPYIIVRLDSQDYAQFTQPYTVDGVTYSYTESEQFRVAETLINYFLYDTVRPANVKVILLATSSTDEDAITVDDELEEVFTVQPMELEDGAVEVDQTQSYNITTIETERSVMGMPGVDDVNSPSYMPSNSLSVIDAATISANPANDEYIYEKADASFTYTKFFEQMNDSVTEMGVFYSQPYIIRTPAETTIDCNLFGYNIEYKRSLYDEWFDISPLLNNTEHVNYDFTTDHYAIDDSDEINSAILTLHTEDINYIRIKKDLSRLVNDEWSINYDFTSNDYEMFDVQTVDEMKGDGMDFQFDVDSYGIEEPAEGMDIRFDEQEYSVINDLTEIGLHITSVWDKQTDFKLANNLPHVTYVNDNLLMSAGYDEIVSMDGEAIEFDYASNFDYEFLVPMDGDGGVMLMDGSGIVQHSG